MKDLWYRFLVGFYRLTGSTPVQAEWKARRALGKPAEAADAVRAQAARNADRRYTCVCGQLLVADDKVCHACGRRQWLPFWLRRAMRAVGLVVPSAVPGTLLAGLSMIIGYAIQLRYGDGGIITPSPGFENYDLGMAIPELVLGSQWWRAFTYTMLHGGLMHIAFNGFALMQVGPLVENAFGTARFAFCWVVGGMLAAVIPALLGVSNPMVGASGSVFALIGMALIWGHRVGTPHGRMVRDVMIRWTLYATIFGVMIGGVAHAAHFAGLASGVAIGFVFPPAGRNATRRRLSLPLGLIGLGLAVASLVAAGQWFATGRPAAPELGMRDRVALLEERARVQGWSAVFAEADVALIDEARQLRKAGRPAADVRAFEVRVEARVRAMDPAEAIVLVRRIEQALYPEGRPSNAY